MYRDRLNLVANGYRHRTLHSNNQLKGLKKMGGNLAITIREENGKEHRMDRWTNSMPNFITNIDLVNNDPNHLKQYLRTWYDFVEDWKENGPAYLESGKDHFKHPMTSNYAQHPFLAPSEYGQVVVDFISKKILHAQGYSSFGEIFRVTAALTLESFWKHDNDDVTAASRLREFFEAGRIKEIFVYGWQADDGPITKIEDIKNSNELYSYLESRHERKDGTQLPDCYANFRIDMSPFEVIEFEQSKEGIISLKKAILDLGFILSDQEHQLWDEYIQ